MKYLNIKKNKFGGFSIYPPGGGHEPTPVFLPGESSCTEEPGRLQSMGSTEILTTAQHSTSIYPVDT